MDREFAMQLQEKLNRSSQSSVKDTLKTAVDKTTKITKEIGGKVVQATKTGYHSLRGNEPELRQIRQEQLEKTKREQEMNFEMNVQDSVFQVIVTFF